MITPITVKRILEADLAASPAELLNASMIINSTQNAIMKPISHSWRYYKVFSLFFTLE